MADEHELLNVPVVTGPWKVDTLNAGGCTGGRVSRAEQYTVSAANTIQGKLDPDAATHVKGTRVDPGASVVKTTITWDLNLEDN